MTTVRVDAYVALRCDGCGTLGKLVSWAPGWRWAFDGWLFDGAADAQLCPSCKIRGVDLKREPRHPPDASPGVEAL